MHFIALPVPAWLLHVSLAAAVIAGLVAAAAAPWRLLLQVPARQHLLFGSIIVLVLIWSLTVPVFETFSLHLLLVTSAVLLLGLSFGVLASLSALAGRWMMTGGDWSLFGLDALCTILVPALVPVLAARLTRRLTQAGIFAFTLGAAFIGGAFSVVATVLTSLGVLWLCGQNTLLDAAWEQVGLLPMLMFGEGFLNGTLMTALAVFQPDLVRMLVEPDSE